MLFAKSKLRKHIPVPQKQRYCKNKTIEVNIPFPKKVPPSYQIKIWQVTQHKLHHDPQFLCKTLYELAIF